MTVTNVISFFAFIISLIALYLSYAGWLHSVCSTLYKEYSSARMHLALEQLWGLYDDKTGERCFTYGSTEEMRSTDEKMCSTEQSPEKKKQVVGYKFSHDKRDTEKKIKDNPSQAEEILQGSIVHSRRLVSLFYQHLATQYSANKLLYGWLIKKEWNEIDLEIIEKIIIPIERQMLKEKGRGDNGTIRKLESFYAAMKKK